MKLLQPNVWLEQAKSDEKASAAKQLNECHRRYFMQQAYEKSVKALGLAILTRNQKSDKPFASVLGDYFLNHHTPLTVLSESVTDDAKNDIKKRYPKKHEKLIKQLTTFRIQLKRRMLDKVDAKVEGIWKKIDATRPSKNSSKVSYRYPFLDGAIEIAPCAYNKWDAYQGSRTDVENAIKELFMRAGNAVKIAERAC